MSKHNSSIGDTSFDIGVFARDYFDENMQLNMDKVKNTPIKKIGNIRVVKFLVVPSFVLT